MSPRVCDQTAVHVQLTLGHVLLVRPAEDLSVALDRLESAGLGVTERRDAVAGGPVGRDLRRLADRAGEAELALRTGERALAFHAG